MIAIAMRLDLQKAHCYPKTKLHFFAQHAYMQLLLLSYTLHSSVLRTHQAKIAPFVT